MAKPPPTKRKSQVATGQRPNVIKPKVPPLRMRIFVVRDREIGVKGAAFVQDLTEMKRVLMATATETPWTLILAIHGSTPRLAAQIPDRPRHDVYYNTQKIAFIFGDDWRGQHTIGEQSLVGEPWWDELFEPEDELGPRELPGTAAVENLAGEAGWDTWRTRFGPTHVVLISCQVGKALEGTLIKHLTRPHPDTKEVQTAQGLGAGCKPGSREVFVTWAGKKIETMKDYLQLPREGKNYLVKEIGGLNKMVGYYGGPPVPEDLLLEYYFDVVPKGAWVKVMVGKVVPGHKDPVSTGIPFWDRATGDKKADFKRLCDQGAGALREHRPIVPP